MDPQLFESMYAEDAEGQKLNKMPAVDEMLLGYPFMICNASFGSHLAMLVLL